MPWAVSMTLRSSCPTSTWQRTPRTEKPRPLNIPSPETGSNIDGSWRFMPNGGFHDEYHDALWWVMAHSDIGYIPIIRSWFFRVSTNSLLLKRPARLKILIWLVVAGWFYSVRSWFYRGTGSWTRSSAWKNNTWPPQQRLNQTFQVLVEVLHVLYKAIRKHVS